MALLQQPISLSLDHVLLATDFTPSSAKALAYTRALAHRFGSEIELVHIFNPTVVTSYEEAILSLYPADRKRLADEGLSRLAESLDATGIKTNILAAEGHRPSSTLLNIAKEQGVDLIVAGTEAHAGLARLILGSTSEQLIRNAQCPVLTVGPKSRMPVCDPLCFRKIVYATDLSPAALKAVPFAVSFAEESAAHLYCCYATGLEDADSSANVDQEKELTTMMRHLISEDACDGCTPEFVVRHGDPATAILVLANQVSADLIILGARKSLFWASHRTAGVVPAVLAEARCPVLSVC